MFKGMIAVAVLLTCLTANADPIQVIEGLRGKASLSPDFPNPSVPHTRDRGAYVSETIAAQVMFENNGITEAMVISGLAGQASLSPEINSTRNSAPATGSLATTAAK